MDLESESIAYEALRRNDVATAAAVFERTGEGKWFIQSFMEQFARDEHLPSAIFLCGATPEGVNVQDERGNTFLRFALSNCQERLVRHLLAQDGVRVDLPNSKGEVALHNAAQTPHRLAEGLLERVFRAGPEQLEARDISGLTPFLRAIHYSQPKNALLLLELGADPYARNNRGESALHLAADASEPGLLERLLAHNEFDVNAASRSGMTPLMVAAKNGYSAFLTKKSALEVLLGCPRTDVNTRTDKQGTALHLAVKTRKDESVRLLLEHGARADLTDGLGQRAADVAPNKKGKRNFQEAFERSGAIGCMTKSARKLR